MIRSEAYWKARAEARVEDYTQQAERTARILRRAYDRAAASLKEHIARIYDSYGKRFGLTPEEARAMLAAPCGYEEYNRLAALILTMPDGPEKTALAARASSSAYAWRANRLENLRDTIKAQAAILAEETTRELNEQLRETIRYAESRAAYDLQRGTGLAWPCHLMDERAVTEILRNPWSGKRFSARVWSDLNALGTLLNTELTQAFLTGQSSRVTARVVADRMGVGYRAAYRLVRTETTAMAEQASLAAYKEAGLERYRYLATLDNRTSRICQNLDGQVFYVKDAQIGKNMPPMHPHCRSTKVPYLGEEWLAGKERVAKDPTTGAYVRVPQSMTYKQWRKLQEDTYGADVWKQPRKTKRTTKA